MPEDVEGGGGGFVGGLGGGSAQGGEAEGVAEEAEKRDGQGRHDGEKQTLRGSEVRGLLEWAGSMHLPDCRSKTRCKRKLRRA